MTKLTADMTDAEFYEAVLGEPLPQILKKQADCGPGSPPEEPKGSIVVDGVRIPAWLGRAPD